MQVPTREQMIRLGVMPKVAAGAEANAENFGAAHWRDVQNLAQAGLHAGNSVLGEAQRRQAKEDDAFSAMAVNQMRSRYADGIKAIYDAHTLDKAVDAPAAVAKFMQGLRTDIGKSLRNRNQQEAFAHAFDAFSIQTEESAFAYRDSQIDALRRGQFLKTAELATEDSAATAPRPKGVDDVLASPNLEVVTMSAGKAEEDQPEEVQKRTILQKQINYCTVVAGAAAAVNPSEALRFLESDKVKRSLEPAEWETLHAIFSAKKTEADRRAYEGEKISWASGGGRNGMERKAAYDQMLEWFGPKVMAEAASGRRGWSEHAGSPPSGEADAASRASGGAAPEGSAGSKLTAEEAEKVALARTMMQSFDSGKTSASALTTLSAIGRDAELEKELRAAKFDAAAMPSFAAMSLEEKEKWLKRGERELKAGPDDVSIDRVLYLDLRKLSPEQLIERWNDAKVRDADFAALGGVNSREGGNISSRLSRLVGGQDAPPAGDEGEEMAGLFATALEECRRVLATASAPLNEEQSRAACNQALAAYDKELHAEMRENKWSGPLKIKKARREEIWDESGGKILSQHISPAIADSDLALEVREPDAEPPEASANPDAGSYYGPTASIGQAHPGYEGPGQMRHESESFTGSSTPAGHPALAGTKADLISNGRVFAPETAPGIEYVAMPDNMTSVVVASTVRQASSTWSRSRIPRKCRFRPQRSPTPGKKACQPSTFEPGEKERGPSARNPARNKPWAGTAKR